MLLIQKLDKVGVKIILLFGNGLIGSAISFELTKFNYLEKSKFKFGWENESEIEIQLTHIFKEIKSIKNKIQSLTIIWSAGKVGFNSTISQAEAEFSFFKASVDGLGRFCSVNNMQKISSFILFSSAGGLHESQTNVYDPQCITLKRPYAKLKKRQEDFLLASNKIFRRNIILRVSTVYPIYNFKGRLGLIAVLFLNSNKGKVSQFYGSENTLRDYISDEDIGKYVVKMLESRIVDISEINYLISGKPTSIFEIKKFIEKILKQRMLIQYKYETTNSANISFNSNLKPKGLDVTNLHTNLCRIHKNLIG